MAEPAAPGSAPVAQAAGNTPSDAGNPAGGGLILASLIIVAAVANLNLSVANVALPSIGAGVRRIADRARPRGGRLLARPRRVGPVARCARRSLRPQDAAAPGHRALHPGLPGWRPSHRRIEVLIAARIVGGVSAGMAYPTTLALITALWAPGPGRTHSIALWSALGGAIASLGPLVSGFLLERFEWGSVFLVTLPLAAVALFMAVAVRAGPRERDDDPVDNLGGILSAVLVGTLILAINFAPVPEHGGAGHRPGADLHRGDRSRSSSASVAPRIRCTTSTSPPGRPSGSRPWPGSSCSAR